MDSRKSKHFGDRCAERILPQHSCCFAARRADGVHPEAGPDASVEEWLASLKTRGAGLQSTITTRGEGELRVRWGGVHIDSGCCSDRPGPDSCQHRTTRGGNLAHHQDCSLWKSVLASIPNVQDFCLGAHNHVGRVEEIRKHALFHPKESRVTPKPSTKCLHI